MSQAVRRIGLGALATPLLSLAVPALAAGSTVDVRAAGMGGIPTMRVIDYGHVPRATLVDFGPGGNTYEVTEGGQPVTAEPPCVQAGPNAARCPIAGIGRIFVNAGHGNDTIQIAPTIPASISTVLRGGIGDDVIEGGLGDDWMVGGKGGDQMIGNGGIDTVSYAKVRKAIAVFIGGSGFNSGGMPDGPPGSRDQVTGSIENVIGGKALNRLIGSVGANVLIGGPKRDRLRGAGGDDRLLGRRGHDYLFGGNGRDRLLGGPGRDRLFGGKGRDLLFGGPGFDRCAGGPGRDTLRSC